MQSPSVAITSLACSDHLTGHEIPAFWVKKSRLGGEFFTQNTKG